MAQTYEPARRYLPLDEWPERDRLEWAAATFRGDLLDVEGRLAWQRPRTIEGYRGTYGRWLTFLTIRGILDRDMPPAARATRTLVAAFVEELRGQVVPLTVALRIIALEQVLRAFDPERDWAWLRVISRRLSRAARPVRDKRAAIRPTDELCAVGSRLMAQAEASIGEDLKHRAEMYRDGLMVALLARRPFRLTNFRSIRIGHQLRQLGTGWVLIFEEHETKTKTHLELPFPEDLLGALDRYLSHWRRALLGRSTHDHLWISSRNSPLGIQGIRLHIQRAVERYLGVHIWPHLFRHCLATHIAHRDPQHAGIAGALLGHRHYGTADRHYIVADQHEAAQRWQVSLLKSRRAAERRQRGE